MIENTSTKTVKRKENPLLNILINIAAPTFILMKFSGEDTLGPTWGLIVALAFPLSYGIYEFILNKKINFFSGLGVFSTLLTGGIALMKLPAEYIAIKEAAIPGIFALVTLLSLKTKYPLVKTFLYNDAILQTDKVARALSENNNTQAFEKALKNASILMALSFMLSSALNYALAKFLLVSPPGSEAFNIELGKMNFWSFPIIAVPATLVMAYALYYIFKEIKTLTALSLDDILVQP